MAIFNSIQQLENQLIKDLQSATQAARNEIEKKLEDNVLEYYDEGSPTVYQRTGTLLTSPTTTEVQGSGKHLSFEVYMDEGIAYDTGTYSGAQVIDATEAGYSGTLGKHGYFKKTDQEVPKILDKEFSKRFK